MHRQQEVKILALKAKTNSTTSVRCQTSSFSSAPVILPSLLYSPSVQVRRRCRLFLLPLSFWGPAFIRGSSVQRILPRARSSCLPARVVFTVKFPGLGFHTSVWLLDLAKSAEPSRHTSSDLTPSHRFLCWRNAFLHPVLSLQPLSSLLGRGWILCIFHHVASRQSYPWIHFPHRLTSSLSGCFFDPDAERC